MGVDVVDQAAARLDLLSRVADLVPGVRERALRGDELRHLPQETVDGLAEAGVMRSLVPAENGGDDLPLEVLTEVTLQLAAADASTAWCANLMMHHAIIVAMFQGEAQAEVWAAGPDVPIASSVIPAVKVEVVDGGFRLSGAAPFSSCSTHADWAIIAGMIGDESGMPRAHLFLVPASDYTIKDTWQTTGMRGTGSNTLLFDGAFVPAHRAALHADLIDGRGPGSELHADPKFSLPWVTYGAIGFACTILGAAQGAFEHFSEVTASRRGPGGVRVAEMPAVQEATGSIAARLDAAEALQRALLVQFDTDPSSPTTRARAMRDNAFTARLAVGAVDEMIRVSGTSAHQVGSSLERTGRDVRMAAAHISLNFEANASHFGRVALGVPRPAQQPYF